MSDIKLNVERTTKDKIFDIVFLVLTLTIWGIIIWLICRAPDIVPTHFGPSGKPDHYGSPHLHHHTKCDNDYCSIYLRL